MQIEILFLLLLIFNGQILQSLSFEILLPDNDTELVLEMYCRTERGVALSLEEYRRDTCARCYFYLPHYAFKDKEAKFSYDEDSGLLIDPIMNISFDADPENVSHPAYATFQSELFARKWISCCRAALDCCSIMIAEPLSGKGSDMIYCPRTWDGWQCWPDTLAGQTAIQLCQEHIYFMSDPPPCPRYAEKHCLSNGSWYINEWDAEWTNYSGCGRIQGMRRLVYFHIITYTISILFLLPALFIFIVYKQLQVYRVTMHKNLFMALLLNALLCILFKAFVILEELEIPIDNRTAIEVNGVDCKILYIMTKYSRMTTYMWMFCEGFYLHKLIAASFAEQKSLKMFYFIGWIFPVFPVGTFAILRWCFADEECWAVPVYPYEWVTNSPNLLSLVLNFLFLCNIIRVLVTKLRTTHTNEPRQFRKAVRATLVLVPLFGLHFFLVIYRPQSGECSVLEVYTFLSYSMDGLQGFLVSLIFCYLNGEVTDLMRRSFYRMRLRYSLDAKPSSVQMSNFVSDPPPKTVIRQNRRNTPGSNTYSIEEISNLF